MRTLAAFALQTLLTFAAAAGAEDAAPSAASPRDVLERARAAQGGAAWDAIRTLRLAGTMTTGGLSGPVESVVDVATGRFRDTWRLGPLRGATGWDGRQAWTQDASGMSRVDGAEAARQGAISDAYRRSQAWWYPDRARAELRSLGERRDGDRAFQALSVAPAGGRPFELWIGADGLVDRTVEVSNGRPLTTSYGDWREVSGARMPFRFTIDPGDGSPAHVATVTWAEVKLDPPASDADFALPPPPRPDFHLARGLRETTVPFRVRNGHILVDVRLDGKGPFRFLVDTGGVNLVTPPVAKALGLAAQGALQGGGVGEATVDVAVAEVKRLQVGEAVLEDQRFYVIPLDGLGPVEGAPLQGLIGYELFRRFPARIDYERARLTLYRPGAFRYDGPGTVLPFAFHEHVPQVDGEIDGLPGRFDLDTGSRGSLDLFAPFVEAHGLVARYGATVERIGGWGLGGPSRGYVARARSLKLGPVEIPEPVVGLSTQKTGAFAAKEVAGNVGYGVLSRFTVYLDYARQQVVLEKNARFARRDTTDRSGLWLHLVGGAFQVMEVVPGTPAAEAGLEVGDRIVAVEGRAPARLGLHELRTLLRERPPGTRVRLQVRRGDGVRRVTLVLRELV